MKFKWLIIFSLLFGNTLREVQAEIQVNSPIEPVKWKRSCQDFAEYGAVLENNYHTGIDISGLGVSGHKGPEVKAVADGTVVMIQINDKIKYKRDHGWGNTVIIRHAGKSNWIYSQYSHLFEIDKKILEVCEPNDDLQCRLCEQNSAISSKGCIKQPILNVDRGETIGTMGGTGKGELSYWPVHLHFEIKRTPELGDVFGYTNNPDILESNYLDPAVLWNGVHQISQKEIIVTDFGSGATLRGGPWEKFTDLGKAVVGERYITDLDASPTSNCEAGWYRIKKAKGDIEAFERCVKQGELPKHVTIRDAWICKGDGTDAWVEELTSIQLPGGAKLATALIIDRSGSMIGYKYGPLGNVVRSNQKEDLLKLEKSKVATRAFISSRSGNDMVSISTFSNSGEQVQSMSVVSTTKDQLDEILGKIIADGGTNIGAGLEQGYIQLSNADNIYNKLAILLSDGENNIGEWETKVEKFKQKGWPICTVGFGTEADVKTLENIAEYTGVGGCYFFGDITDIVHKFQGINAYASGESPILQANDALSPQSRVSYPFFITTPASKLNAYTSWQGSKLDTVLIAPDGRKIDKQYVTQERGRYEEGSTFQMLELENPQQGKWVIEVGWSVPPLETEQVNLMVTEKTDIFVRIHGFQSQYSIGEPVAIKVDAQELSGTIRKIPLINPELSIQVQKPGLEIIRMVQAQSSNWTMFKDVVIDVTRDVVLSDDGNHEDNKEGDGIFGGIFTETDKNGAYLVTVTINAQKQNGESVEKTLIGTFQVGKITDNQVTTSQTLNYMEQVKSHIDDSTPVSKEITQQPLDEIDKLQTDPRDAIDRLMN